MTRTNNPKTSTLKQWIPANPWYIKNFATKLTVNSGLSTRVDGPADALRHIMGSAWMAANYPDNAWISVSMKSEIWTLFYRMATTNSTFASLDFAAEMDIKNNRLGVNLWNKHHDMKKVATEAVSLIAAGGSGGSGYANYGGPPPSLGEVENIRLSVINFLDRGDKAGEEGRSDASPATFEGKSPPPSSWKTFSDAEVTGGPVEGATVLGGSGKDEIEPPKDDHGEPAGMVSPYADYGGTTIDNGRDLVEFLIRLGLPKAPTEELLGYFEASFPGTIESMLARPDATIDILSGTFAITNDEGAPAGTEAAGVKLEQSYPYPDDFVGPRPILQPEITDPLPTDWRVRGMGSLVRFATSTIR